jgi:hypothetical protein
LWVFLVAASFELSPWTPRENREIRFDLSISALNWAFAQKIKPATRKFVLVTLANFANEDSLAFPCIQTLEDFTCLDRKTIVSCLTSLMRDGLIEDTGDRKGITKQVRVFKVKASESIPKTEPSQKRNCSVFPTKGTQKRDTEPSGNPLDDMNENKAEAIARINRLKAKLSEFFRRKPNQTWTYADEFLLAEINRREGVEDELSELLSYRTKTPFFPTSLRSFLEKWDSTLDRSRQPAPSHAANQFAHKQPVNGNTGTLNENRGNGAKYTAKARAFLTPRVQNDGQPGTDADAGSRS